MKQFHQNLLVVLASSLCLLCVYQWYSQTQQRRQLTAINQSLYEKSVAIQGYTNSILSMDKEITQMDRGLFEIRGALKTNETALRQQKVEVALLQGDKVVLKSEVDQYKQAVDALKTKLQDAYDGFEKQNDAIKQLTAQRDDFVQKFNASVKERNEIVSKYNDLVKTMGKQSSK